MERDEPFEFEQRGDELEGEADRMEQQRDRVKGRIQEAERDWEAKKSDSSVPGAVEDDLDQDSGESGEQSEDEQTEADQSEAEQ